MKKSNNHKLTFSGHESFQCRSLWLKKGYDFVKNNRSFNDEDAVVILGVGNNMVRSIRFWMKAFNLLTNEDQLTEFAHRIFDDINGYDPYLEDEATLWLLHYELVKKGYASTYSIIFNELRREKIEFTREHLIGYIRRKTDSEKTNTVNEKTIADDFYVFTKMYHRTDANSKDKDDIYSGILTELGLVKAYRKDKDDYYLIENTERDEIPEEVLLYSILDNSSFDASINLSNIETDKNGATSVFAINRPGLISKIESLAKKYDYLVYNDQAGVKELQFKRRPDPFSILKEYYEN